MLLRLAPLSILLLSTACASITTGTTQAVTVQTEPPGAMCLVSRNGETLGIVNPTPGSLNVSKSSQAMTVRCERPGSQVALTTVPSSMQAMTAGNILFGGIIGLGIDAASGAMNQYPPNISLALAAQPLPPVPPAAVMEPIPDQPAQSRRRRAGV